MSIINLLKEHDEETLRLVSLDAIERIKNNLGEEDEYILKQLGIVEHCIKALGEEG